MKRYTLFRELPRVVAIVFIIMTVLQLVKFEALIQIMSSYYLLGNEGSIIITILIIALQIMAVPFLTGLRVASLAKWLSAAAVLAVPSAWLLIGIIGISQHPKVIASGLLGGALPIAADWPVLLCNLLLLGAAVKSFLYLGGPAVFKHKT